MTDARLDLAALEGQAVETASEKLPALAVARLATEALLVAMEGAEIRRVSPPAPPRHFLRVAVLQLSVIAFRTARAILLVISAGYWPESIALKRRLSEVHARLQHLADDPSGQRAERWLEGKGPGKAQKIVGTYGGSDTWDVYSWAAHADARGVARWVTVPIDPADTSKRGLVGFPFHDERHSNALLTECAMECRDIAAAQAFARGGQVQGMDELDAEIDRAIARYYDPVKPDG